MLSLINEPKGRKKAILTPPLQHAAAFLAFLFPSHLCRGVLYSQAWLIASPVEDVVDLPTNISPEPQKLAIDAMQNGLEKVPLSRVFAIK